MKGYIKLVIYGNVKSLNYNHTKKEKVMKPAIAKNGYLRICFKKNGIKKNFSIHRLVAEAFIVNEENKTQINHIDGNKENNCVNNLEFCTPKENIQEAYTLGLIKRRKEIAQYDLKGNFIKKWAGMREAERALNITGIWHCCKGIKKTAGGYKWKYYKA